MEQLRPARIEDLDELSRLRILMFEAMGTPSHALESDEWQAAARAWFIGKLDDDAARILVLDDGGEVLAGGLAEVLPAIPAPSMPRGRVGFISNVATLPHARGRGFARQVMNELVRWLDDEGDADRIDLAATAEGAPLYSSMGFTRAAFPTMRRPVPARVR